MNTNGIFDELKIRLKTFTDKVINLDLKSKTNLRFVDVQKLREHELEEFKRIERSLIEDNKPNLDELEEFQRIENSIIQDKEVPGMRVGLKYNNAISFGNEEEF